MKKTFLPILLVLAFVGVCYAQFGGPMPTTNTNPQVTTTPSPNNVPQAYNNGNIDAGWLPSTVMIFPSCSGILNYSGSDIFGNCYGSSNQIPANYIANLSESQITNLISDLAAKAVLPGWTSPQTGVMTGTPPSTAPASGNPDFWFDSSNYFNLGYGLNTNGPINTPGPVSIGAMYLTANNLAELTADANFAGTVFLTSPVTLTGNLTLTCDLRLLNGATITTTGYTLAIKGGLHAGRYQCFAGSGTVTFGATTVEAIYPEWWGANTTPGTTDMSAEIAAAITAAQNLTNLPGGQAFGGKVSFAPTVYFSSKNISITGAITFKGASEAACYTTSGNAGTTLLLGASSSGVGISISGNGANGAVIKDFVIATSNGTSTNSGVVGIDVEGGPAHVLLSNIIAVNSNPFYPAIQAGKDGNNVLDLRIVRCRIGYQGQGIYLHAAVGTSIEDSEIYTNGNSTIGNQSANIILGDSSYVAENTRIVSSDIENGSSTVPYEDFNIINVIDLTLTDIYTESYQNPVINISSSAVNASGITWIGGTANAHNVSGSIVYNSLAGAQVSIKDVVISSEVGYVLNNNATIYGTLSNLNVSGTGASLVANPSSTISIDGPIYLNGWYTSKGTTGLSSGSGAGQTVPGATSCVCSDGTALDAAHCTVPNASGAFTLTGTGSDVIAWMCR